jgi:hypothetical protein
VLASIGPLETGEVTQEVDPVPLMNRNAVPGLRTIRILFGWESTGSVEPDASGDPERPLLAAPVHIERKAGHWSE